MPRIPVRRVATLAAIVSLVLAAACGGADDDTAETGTTPVAETTTTTTEPQAAPLRVLVTNDDGVGAAGIDAVVEALRLMEGVEVTVVAPLQNQSGSGGRTTEGELAVAEATTASGYPATSVDGFPADSVDVAFDQLGVEVDLVVSGTNKLQNVGSGIDLSGTVGAARAGAAHGVPALAVSTGFGAGGPVGPDESFDFAATIPFVVDWIEAHRAALSDGSAPVEVANLNVPTCTEGEVRGLHEASVDYEGEILVEQDCTSTEEPTDSDTQAFSTGWAVLTAPLPAPAG